MPFISIHTNQQPSKEKKDIIKTKLGEIIALIPGKSESVLMIEFVDNSTFYMGVIEEGNCAMIDVKCFRQAEFEANKHFTEECSKLLECELEIPRNRLYLTITELLTWGTGGSLK